MRYHSRLWFLFAFASIALCTVTLGCGDALHYVPGVKLRALKTTNNPLVAQYTVLTALGCPGQVMVEFGPDTSYGRRTAWFPVPASSNITTILVAGMKATTTYHMRAQAQAQCTQATSYSTDDATFTTGTLPSLPFPTVTVTRPSPSPSSPENAGIEMITVPTINTPAFFTDRDGNPIWYYDVGQSALPYVFKLLPNGNIIIMITANPIATTYAISSIREIDLAGNLIRELDIPTLGKRMQAAGFDFAPDNYTHDLFPLENGHLILLTNYSKNFTDLPGYPGSLAVVGDGLVDLDENWNPVWAWNSFDHLDVNRHLNGLPDWTHGNGVGYSPSDGNLLLSLRHQSWILKIDYSNGTGTGNVLWRLGYQGDFALTANGVPTDDPSQWFSFQHFPVVISQTGPQTMLGVWDNGNNRVLNIEGVVCGPLPVYNIPCHSVATIFQIDESAKVADLAWTDSPGLYSLWGGSLNQLANGNVEFDANAPVVPPVANAASIVQEVTQTAPPQVVWQMAITPGTSNAYRAYRYPSLYNGVTWQY
jgi:arylsulfate sulfotransferase